MFHFFLIRSHEALSVYFCVCYVATSLRFFLGVVLEAHYSIYLHKFLCIITYRSDMEF